ncbi:MAG: DnaJ domain-containing protein [Phycisphaeraceae bacterium]|nr:DnaJ domain-containing protein [Phycisphaeraceae bacterium]
MAEYHDYYGMLGVSRDATAEEIQRAFRKLAREFHPDLNSTHEAEMRFKAINEAYEVLKDTKRREMYDSRDSDWTAAQDPDLKPDPSTSAPLSSAPMQPDTEPLSPAPRKRLLTALGRPGALGIAWLIFPPLGGFLLFAYMKSVAEWFRNHGDAGGVGLFILGFMILAGLGLLPTYAQAILAGFAFTRDLGLGIAFLAALAGFTGAATLGYLIARRVSGDRVVTLIETNRKARAVRNALIAERRPLRTLGVVALLRLPPNSPFALTNLVMAGVRVPLPLFIPATMIGMAPRTFAAVYFGSTLEEFVVDPKPPRAIVIAGFVITVIVVLVIGYLAQRALDRLSGPTPAEQSAPDAPSDA